MSAADSLDRDLSGSVPPQDSLPVELAVPPDLSPDGWETVDCPGTLSVDAIPRGRAASLAADVSADALGELTRVKQDNMDLRDRTTQLEQDFAQAQIEWQLETARLLHQVSESTPPEQAQAVQAQLTTAHEQLSRLFQELELCHQTAQRQQILVETLTEQLESGQERIAELERDCATTQQRYNEQVQQRLQAEATCRDLRIRLNRQQQHTLQFKVALEKCLEVPASSSRSGAELDLSQSFAAPPLPLPTVESIIASQNSPVQPWSASVSQLSLKPSLSHLLQDVPHSEAPIPLIDPKPAIQDSALQESSIQDTGDLMNLIFPGSEPPAFASDSTNAFFDIQPLLETESGTIVPPSLSTQIQQASDTLWQDLTTLIDSPNSETEAPEQSAKLQPSVSEAAAPEQPTAISADLLPKVSQIPGLTASFEEARESSRSAAPILFSGSPSPVVYPLRPIKKRESLAAVELPSFPRKAQ